jgi:hypothetical protein
MIASLLIIAVSLVLFLYWLRYTCLLLLQGAPVTERAGLVARANRLQFPEVRKLLASEAAAEGLDALQASLDCDFRILIYLLEHSTGLELPALEQKLLVLDYRLMRLLYRILKTSSVKQAREALVEMADVLGYFSQKMGERAAQTSLAA